MKHRTMLAVSCITPSIIKSFSYSTVFGRRNDANLSLGEEVIYRSNEITPDQSALLERPNFVQYPTEQELSIDKDTTTEPITQEIGQENLQPSPQSTAEEQVEVSAVENEDADEQPALSPEERAAHFDI